jgi:hypothetical protein
MSGLAVTTMAQAQRLGMRRRTKRTSIARIVLPMEETAVWMLRYASYNIFLVRLTCSTFQLVPNVPFLEHL